MGLLKHLNPFCWNEIGNYNVRMHVWLDCSKLYSTIQVDNWPIKLSTIWKRLLWVRVRKRSFGFIVILGFGLIHKIAHIFIFPGGVHNTDIVILKKNVKEKIAFWKRTLAVDK